MNKISKKIVSAVTMGAFALTLVPAAAFAATGTDSTVTVDKADQALVLENGKATANVGIEVGALDAGENIVVWAVKGNAVDQDVTIYTSDTNEVDLSSDADWNGYYVLDGSSSQDGTKYDVTFTFDTDGEYVIMAGVSDNKSAQKPEQLTDITVVNAGVDVYAPNTELVVKDSQLLVDGDNEAVTVDEGVKTDVEFNVVDNKGAASSLPLNAGVAGGEVYVWVENSKGQVVDVADFTGATPVAGTPYWKVTGPVVDKYVVGATFDVAGEGYTIHAGVSATAPNGSNDADKFVYGSEVLPITFNVNEAAAITEVFSITGVTDATVSTPTGNSTTWVADMYDNVTPSDTKTYTVKGVAWTDAIGSVPATNEEIAVSAEKGLVLGGLSEEGTVTTNERGEFSFTFTLTDAGQYEISMREVNNDASATLLVKQDDVDAIDIEKVKDGGYVLAGNDYDYAGQVYGHGDVYLSDAVQFAITDAYGREAMGPGPLADEAAANAAAPNHADSLEIKNQPEKTVNSDDFELAWDNATGVYTLAYVDADKDGAAKDLVPGEYSVRVALNNGGRQAVTVNFTVAQFGDVQEIVLDTTAHAGQSWEANDNAITAIDNQVALGQWVNVVPKYVDANGLKVKADISDLQVGVNGDAVVDRHITKDTIAFRVANNTAANNAYVGSTITVRVNDPSLGAIGYVVKELTVVKNYQAETVSIDPTQGVVGEPNTVNVTVVAGEEISKVNGKLSATIVGQSDETADVNVRVNPDVKNGKASLYLESDKAGTADVRVVVTADNGELYADTFTYTFGDEDPYAGSYIVMTIGSDQYLINNEVLDGSKDNLGAPYVDDAWRTMVPVRVLAESFGADVDFDEEAQTVTVVDGDTTIVMTVGSTEYTINGEPAEAMNTAPVIGSDNRTYVPVRFVAEGLGYEVTPMYDAENGTTASVVFMK